MGGPRGEGWGGVGRGGPGWVGAASSHSRSENKANFVGRRSAIFNCGKWYCYEEGGMALFITFVIIIDLI